MDDTDSIKSEHGVSNPCACIVGCSPWKRAFKTWFCRKVELNLDLDLICIYLNSLAATYVCFTFLIGLFGGVLLVCPRLFLNSCWGLVKWGQTQMLWSGCIWNIFFLYIMLLYYILIRYFSGYTVGEEAGQLMGGSASPSTCELVKMLQRAMKMKAPSAYRHTQLPWILACVKALILKAFKIGEYIN